MGTTRNPAIDRFRGAAVFLMVLVNFLGGVDFVPAFLKHAPDIGFTVADAVAPMFIFAIGLTYGPSFLGRFQKDKFQAYRHFILRYFAILGIGALLSAGGTAVAGQPSTWGVLQAIGMSGLLTLLFIRLSPAARIVSGAAILCLYQLALDQWLLSDVLRSSHGGFFGAVSWGAMLIIATGLADLFRKGLKPYTLVCLGIAVLSVVSMLFAPVSKNRVSLSYVLIALALSGYIFLAFDRISAYLRRPSGYFAWWGENPLALYILHLLVLGLIELPSPRSWYAGAPAWLSGLEMLFLFASVSLAAWGLHRKNIRLSL